jgi:hypothetical protein
VIQVKQLGLKQPSYSLVDLLKTGQNSFNGIVFVERTRDLNHKVKRYFHLSETERRHAKVEVVNKRSGYYVLEEHDSVIFYSFCDLARGISFYGFQLFKIIDLHFSRNHCYRTCCYT